MRAKILLLILINRMEKNNTNNNKRRRFGPTLIKWLIVHTYLVGDGRGHKFLNTPYSNSENFPTGGPG